MPTVVILSFDLKWTKDLNLWTGNYKSCFEHLILGYLCTWHIQLPQSTSGTFQYSNKMHAKMFLFWHKKKMAGCFDFRMRTSSFDLHQLAQRHKLAKITKLFRSKSDESVKESSPKGSPTSTPGRRRFVRVVRNEEAAGEEWENPHVIRRYDQTYLQKKWQEKSQSIEDSTVVPYEVTGHTILKKHSSQDSNNSGDSTPKHASFCESVEIIEFDRKSKVDKIKTVTHTERLHVEKEDYMVIMYKDERVGCKDRCPMPPKSIKELANECIESDENSSDIDQSFESDSDITGSCPHSEPSECTCSDSEMQLVASHRLRNGKSSQNDSSPSVTTEMERSSSVERMDVVDSTEMSSILASKLMEVSLERCEEKADPLIMAES